jgi:Probable lipid transfer
MADCIDFVQLGSNSTKPAASCCVGLKKVVKENERCLCDALGNSEEYGIKLNMTRAVAMPSACEITTPSASNCKSMLAFLVLILVEERILIIPLQVAPQFLFQF